MFYSKAGSRLPVTPKFSGHCSTLDLLISLVGNNDIKQHGMPFLTVCKYGRFSRNYIWKQSKAYCLNLVTILFKSSNRPDHCSQNTHAYNKNLAKTKAFSNSFIHKYLWLLNNNRSYELQTHSNKYANHLKKIKDTKLNDETMSLFWRKKFISLTCLAFMSHELYAGKYINAFFRQNILCIF